MSKKLKKRQQQMLVSGQRPWLWAAVGALLLVVAGGLILWNSADTAPAVAPEVSGAPKLAVDQTTIDEGYQKYDAPVETAFRLRNVGDQPLKILETPQVVLAEGCWPPKAVVSSTTINPGQEAVLTMNYTMHEGMDGPHEFHVYLQTNDPVEPEKVLIAKSDWGP